jgi:hypothetical protein
MEFKIIENTINTDEVVLSCIAPKTGIQKQNNIIICYDKSYSMSECSNPNGNELMKTYSKNDLSSHMVEIIASTLDENDTFTIVTYDSIVSISLSKTSMTKTGKDNAIRTIKSIQPGGGTSLYDGMIEALNRSLDQHGDCLVLMMTDGEPSKSPMQGEVNALIDYRRQTGNNCRMYTIGIGYQIKSKLLYELANIGDNGSCFIFIPDGSMMVTSAVNLLAYDKSICAKDIQYGSKCIGTIAYGQTKNIICKKSEVTDAISYYSFQDNKQIIKEIKKTVSNEIYTKEKSLNNILIALNDILMYASYDNDKAVSVLKDIINNEMKSKMPILEDLMGEVSTAIVSKDAFNKWGCHYIRSMITAHKNQRSFNFKDKGPQAYDSDMIKEMKTKIDEIAKTVEPPIQSLLYQSRTTSYSAPAPVVTRQTFDNTFNNAYGGCFGGNGIVSMTNNTTKYVKDLVKGDVLHNGAKIECVVSFRDCIVQKMSSLNDLVITPWHPIYVSEVWKFPADYEPTAEKFMENIVYTFVLDKIHIIQINGVDACTLGHNLRGPVIGHEFYGTNTVVNDLKKFPEYMNGLVELTNYNMIYDYKNQVVGYIP